MKRYCFAAVLSLLLWAPIHASAQNPPAPAEARSANADLAVWQQFLADLKAGRITATDLRPYYENLRAPNFKYLTTFREQGDWNELQAAPEVHHVGDHLHFLLPLTLGGGKTTYCFTFVNENGKWFYQHLEGIFIRLDRTGAPPVSAFPDISEGQKAWIREEGRVHDQVQLFNLLAKEKGKSFAFDWFRDGYGYFLAAKTWVPFVAPERAFILYACWEQANLRGNRVTLEALSDTQARIRMDLDYFRLYQQSGDLYQKIAFEDYRRIFETIWQDRAEKAGWKLNLTCKDAECVFEFSRPADAKASAQPAG
jgi:hypothetical protein